MIAWLAFPQTRVPEVRRLTVILATLIWTAVVVFSLWTQRAQMDRTVEALAKNDAIANLKKDMAIRKWAASVGGVYVDESRLHNVQSLEEQAHLSAVKSNGAPLKLVLLTPIHTLLAIQETHNKEYGGKERLTSKQLRNQSNAPDEWETRALKSLQSGAELASDVVPGKGGHGLMRVMIPMRMDRECLECHRDTLIPEGGLRGGAVASIDLGIYRATQEPAWRTIQYWHFAVWLLGLSTIFTFGFFARRRTLEQERQNEERIENELAFSAMAEGALITDAYGTILWVNDAFCEINGYSRDEVLGKTPRILKSGKNDESVYHGMWQQLRDIGQWRGVLWNRRKSGEIYPEQISIKALRAPATGQIRRYVAVFSDISERKRSEEAIHQLNQSLEKRVEEEVAKNREKDHLLIQQSRLASMGEMAHNMAHLWRQPLNSVGLILQNIQSEYEEGLMDKESLKAMVADGFRVVGKMSATIDDFRNFFQTSESATRFNLVESVREALSLMDASFENDGIYVAVETPLDVFVEGHFNELSQVLLNVLTNARDAIQSMGKRGEIIIWLGHENDMGVVRIRDNGAGIPAGILSRIFDPYFTTKISSTGIGLYMARMILEHMHGRIEAHNIEGGTEIAVFVPATS
jgi:PAS domain S-box-containing protein